MTDNKMHKMELLLFFIAIAAAVTGVYYLGPSITGFAIKEFAYENDANLVVTSNGNYTFELKDTGDLKSLKIDGRMTNYGNAKVYLESNGIKYLVFDSSRIGVKDKKAENGSSLITGLAVKEDKDKKKKNKKPQWIGNNEFAINETTTINLSQQFTDADGDALIYSASAFDGLEILINNEMITIKPTKNESFNATITFTASDGIDSKNHIVSLMVLIGLSPNETFNETTNETINITPKINNAPKWVFDVDLFVLNKTLSIDLMLYFTDEDNNTLTFSSSDAANIDEIINGSILKLTTTLDNFNTTSTITASDGNLSASKEINLIVPLTLALPTAKSIAINLNYKSGTVYDANNNGEESVNGVVDLTVENTGFNWDVDKSRLCTRWEVYNMEDGKLTTFCNGNNDCCAFVGLLPTKAIWDEVYYSTFGKDNAGYSSIVSAQVLYYDVNLSIENPKSEIYNSEWGNKTVKFFDEEAEFLDECVETCALKGLNKSSYTLLFEIEDNAILRIDKIKYDLLIDVKNNAPLLLKNFSAVNASKNKNATINLSQHFSDPDGDALSYNYYKADNITILFEYNTATIIPDRNAEGIRFTYISANDSESSAVSNAFMINISAPQIAGITGYFFEIRNAEDKRLAAFDSLGNLNIKGNLTQNAQPTADENDFGIQGLNGLNGVITNPEGNMAIKGALNENQSIMIPTPNSFIIQNSDGEAVAYINSTGSLFLKGALKENVLFG